MRTKTIILICLLLTISSYGQDLMEKYPEIKHQKNEIDKNKSLNKIVLENEEFLEQMTDGGGILTGLYDENKEIRKIEVKVFISTGVQEYSFYLKNENLILIIDNFKRFAWNEKTSEFDYDKFDGGFSGTYLFKNKNLIDHISLGHNRFEDDQIDIQETFLNEINYYKNLIKKRLANNG